MRMLTKRTKIAAAVFAAAFGAPSAVFAASVNVDLDTSTAGVQATRDVSNPPQTFASTINFVGDGTVTNVSGRLDYDTTRLDATVTAASGAVCAVNEAAGQIAFTTTSGSGSALGSQTVCNVSFTVPGTVTPPQTIPLAFSNMTFAGSAGGDTTAGGTINVTTGPSAPVLSYNPAPPGPIVMSPAGIGTTSTGSVAVTAGAGTAGTSTSLACTGSAGFTATVTGSPFDPNETGGSVNVSCTTGASAVSGTVSCQQTPSVGTAPAANVFNVTCPAGGTAPEFSATLSASLVGAPNTTATGSIAINNTGTGPMTITCGAPTGGFTVTSAPASPVAAGGSTSIGLSCVTPAAAGATATGSLVCTTNDSDEGTVTFALSCTSQVLSVPAMGSFGKGIMIALLAGLGLLGFAMRRRAV